MKFSTYVMSAVLILVFLSSCSAHKRIGYMQEVETLTAQELAANAGVKDLRFMPGDLLTIVVTTTDPNASKVFNIVLPRRSKGQDETIITGQEALQTYLVDKDGNIDFPVLGHLAVGGKTKTEVEEMIRTRIYPKYITEAPIITIRLTNFKVSVMGEVARPNVYTMENERATILEAITMAGDLTIYGKRENVLLLRQDADGKKRTVRINLQDRHLLLSDVYQLQQNDVIYVEPNKSKGNTSRITQNETIWFSVLGTLMSVATLLITVLK
ncbi:MAG: polysaccharide biosynthesis/export family protein [Bacteroidales bacterium]